MLAVTRHRRRHGRGDARRGSSSRSSRPRSTGRAPASASSTVYGIVKQSGGYIEVESEPGRGHDVQGATCRASTDARRRDAGPTSAADAPAHGHRDGPARRGRAGGAAAGRARAPERAGYTVLEARRRRGGARRSRDATQGPIDLLVTDVVMPGMSGRELAERLPPSGPDLRVAVHVGLHRRRASCATACRDPARRSCRSRSRSRR